MVLGDLRNEEKEGGSRDGVLVGAIEGEAIGERFFRRQGPFKGVPTDIAEFLLAEATRTVLEELGHYAYRWSRVCSFRQVFNASRERRSRPDLRNTADGIGKFRFRETTQECPSAYFAVRNREPEGFVCLDSVGEHGPDFVGIAFWTIGKKAKPLEQGDNPVSLHSRKSTYFACQACGDSHLDTDGLSMCEHVASEALQAA